VNQISRERLNQFAPNSQGRRAWSLAWISLNVKVKGKGHQQKTRLALPSPPAATEWNAFAANNVTQQQTAVASRGDFVVLCAVCLVKHL